MPLTTKPILMLSMAMHQMSRRQKIPPLEWTRNGGTQILPKFQHIVLVTHGFTYFMEIIETLQAVVSGAASSPCWE